MSDQAPAEQPFRVDGGFERLLGLEVTELSDEVVRAELAVRDELLGAAGDLHGGVYAAIADSLAARGAAASLPDGTAPVGFANQTSVLGPISQGAVHAVAMRRHRGRTTSVWQIEFHDGRERLCAFSRVTIALRSSGR